MIVPYAFVTGVAALYCCVGLWAAVSERPWFARACVVLCALALLLPIRAYEPIVLFGLTALVLFGGALALRLMQRESRSPHEQQAVPRSGQDRSLRSPYHFGLRDLLLTITVAGGGSWLFSTIVANGIAISGWRYGLAAILLAALTAAAAGIVLFVPRWPWWLLLAIALPATVAVDRFVLGDWLKVDDLLAIYRNARLSRNWGLDSLAWLYTYFVAWVAVIALATAIWMRPIHSAVIRTSLRVASVMVLSPCVVVGGAVYWHMLGTPRPPTYAVRRDNVLPRILTLSEQLSNASPRAAQRLYSELWSLLQHPGSTEIDWRRVDQSIGGHSSLALQSSHRRRDLARQLQAESAARRAQGKYDEAADFALANLRYGAMLDREGLIVHRLDAEAVLGMGHAELARCREHISPSKAAEAARLLESITANREPVDATVERDNLFSNLSMTWRYRLERAIGFDIWGRKPTTVADSTLAVVHKRNVCLANLLTVDLALRAYRADCGAWPDSLEELAPEYLMAAPLDQYSDKPLIYRVHESGFVLYSVGQGGQDEGGKFAALKSTLPWKTGFDLDVDTLIRP